MGRPWTGPVRITWPAGEDKAVYRGATDEAGKLAGITLDGGVEYRLHLGEVSLPLDAQAGTNRTVTFDRDRLVMLECPQPPRLDTKELRHIPVEVRNHGSGEVTLKLNAIAGANLKTPPTAEVTIPAGQSRTITLRARCRRAGLPWILHLRDAEPGRWLLDITGPAEDSTE
jgi:hypothetical protein